MSKAPQQTFIDYPDSDAGLDQAIASWRRTSAGAGSFRQTVSFQPPGRPQGELEQVAVEYRFTRGEFAERVEASLDGVKLSLDAPVHLQPVSIPKPWGREIWYTGMERRGECRVATAEGSLPLSSYLALAPNRLCRRLPVVLLKILDPAATPGTGDLYFEVHEQKREVYVVTRVDQTAWPDGQGAIRLGMNQSVRATFANDVAFRNAYLAAVKAYEAVRRQIDAGDRSAAASENDLRAAMERFTALAPLRVGDVVTVHPWLPHSLQHGVRVAEFQTPTYERYILSFGQAVLTQKHWDTEAVLERIDLEPPRPGTFAQLAPGVEQIADFDDFSALRIELAAGDSCCLGADLPYAVCMAVDGRVSVNGLELNAEEACFVPASALPVTITNLAAAPAVALMAAAKP